MSLVEVRVPETIILVLFLWSCADFPQRERGALHEKPNNLATTLEYCASYYSITTAGKLPFDRINRLSLHFHFILDGLWLDQRLDCIYLSCHLAISIPPALALLSLAYLQCSRRHAMF